MSERVALIGAKAPPKTVTVGEAAYSFSPAITYSVMTAFEAAVFEADKAKLRAVKDLTDSEEYKAAVRELVLAYQTGEYAFEGKRSQAHLQTPPGMLALLRCLSVDGATDDELFELITKHSDALTAVLEEILETSFPDAPASDAPAPKVKAPRHKRGR